jgi:hypothetical protein
MDAEDELLVVDEALLATALGVLVSGQGEPPTYRFQQSLAFADGLCRRSHLDLAARRFRSTLWAGPHRCLDHLEVADLSEVTCDPAAGRLVLSGGTWRLVLTRQGTLSAVPIEEATGWRALRQRRR